MTTILERLACAVVPRIADWCIVDLIQNHELRRVAMVHSKPTEAKLFLEFKQCPIKLSEPFPVCEVIRSKQSKIFHGATDELLKSLSPCPEHLPLLRVIGFKTNIVVPMILEKEVLGTISFASVDSKKIFLPRDLLLCEEIARRASIAIENAKLYQERQNAVKARDEVLSIVSHDLKNPISAVLLNVDLLSRFLLQNTQVERNLELIERIKKAAARALGLIQNLLDSSKLDSGHFEMDLQVQKVSKIVEESIELLSPIAAEKGITLDVQIAENVSHTILCDHERILQVFSNLIGNAVKFSPEKGTIQIRVAEKRGQIHFSVADSGPGMSEQDLPHIFDRYWQAKKTHAKGTGLGLYIAKGIIEAHKGKIWVESKEGDGAVFHFVVPAL